ncbi:MAG: AAA family ATPase [Bacteroidota bacterium]
MSSYTKKYIITGAPGTGKTTLIKALENQYPCIHEASREVIVAEQTRNGDGVPWKNVFKFAELVYQTSIAALNSNPKAILTDRSILDLIAYLQIAGEPIPQVLQEFPYHSKYEKTVFFAPAWQNIFHQDMQRLQSFSYCLELEKALKQNYRDRGFEIMDLPRESVENRVSFVGDRLRR